ncbi:MAG: FG-GAP repeat protein [Acidobacteria bacterium]|nr:FG-GAP repeat protein [Acidobacteriota bacterium]
MLKINFCPLKALLPAALVLGAGLCCVPAATLHVDDDNGTGTYNGTARYPYRTIQAAVNAAAAGDTVKVAAGNYGYVAVSSKAVVLWGGFRGGTAADYQNGPGGDFTTWDRFSNVSTITGDASHAGVSLQVTNNDEESLSGAVVTGFRITGGSHGVDVGDNGWPYPRNVTVSDNLIEDNGLQDGSSDNRGGGVVLHGDQLHLLRNDIVNNRSGRGGGVYAGAESADGPGVIDIEGNRIENNRGYNDHGGGVCLAGDTHYFTGNVVKGNRVMESYGWGGGLITYADAAHFNGNTFCSNYAPSCGGGVFVDEGGEAWFDHDLVCHNASMEAGMAGILVDDGTPGRSYAHLRNCTLAYNQGPGDRGGNAVGLFYGSFADVTNCICWGNGDDFNALAGSAFTSITYTLSEETAAGVGNVSADPLFADPDVLQQDFHLRSAGGRFDPTLSGGAGGWVWDAVTSPAVDAGNPADAFDQEPPRNGGRVNLGIYGNTPQASRTAWPTPGSDFDGDGKADLFWRNAVTGDNSIWLMDGAGVKGALAFPAVPPAWKVAATGDFDGDGHVDLLWRHATAGYNVVWYLDGNAVTGEAAMMTVSTAWDVAAAADVNGDGRDDLVWRHLSAGHAVVWYLLEDLRVEAQALPTVDPSWELAAAADFNGDAKPDILWRHTPTGANGVWFLDGVSVLGDAALPAVGTDWRLATVGDFDGDGDADLLWRQPGSGVNAIWALDGLAVTGDAPVQPVPQPWDLVE